MVKEQRAAPDLEAVQAAVLKCLGNVEFASDQSSHHVPRDEPGGERLTTDEPRGRQKKRGAAKRDRDDDEALLERSGAEGEKAHHAERDGYVGDAAKVNRFEYDVSSDEFNT